MTDVSAYATDIVTWSQRQVDALRRLAAVAPSNAVDWDNVIEEIESLGRSEWRGVESHLAHALAHVLKAVSDPRALSVRARQAEVGAALVEARRDYCPSMARLLDPDEIWRLAVRRAAEALTPYGISIPPAIPATCPWTLAELTGEDFSFVGATARLDTLFTNGPGDPR